MHAFPFSGARHRIVAILIAAAALVSISIPPSEADAAKVTAMTRNIYLGADLTPALTATTTTDLFEEAGSIYRAVEDTNFPARAKLLAQEIADTDPDLIGLQEVALWRRGERGVVDGPTTPATEVVYDFLDTLRHQLHQEGLHYRVASKQREADLELAVDFNDDDVLAPVYDVRLTMRDVILAKRGVDTANEMSENYTTAVPVPTPVGTIPVQRGWNSVDVNLKDRRFRFVNTHLEAFEPNIRAIQAFELTTGPLDTDKTLILVGDLNSDPADSPPQSSAYTTITDVGFVDRGVLVDTCCHDADLLDAGSQFDQRIDHILTRPGLDLLNAVLVGDDPAMRTPYGLWPSDHGGVVSTLDLG